jgi:hypothetical protein
MRALLVRASMQIAILTLSFNTSAQGYDATKANQFYQQLISRVQALPAFERVSLAQYAAAQLLLLSSVVGTSDCRGA